VRASGTPVAQPRGRRPNCSGACGASASEAAWHCTQRRVHTPPRARVGKVDTTKESSTDENGT
jgi:hypothetical protein